MQDPLYETIEDATTALGTAAMDCAADFGDDVVEAAWGDLVAAIAGDCPPDVAAELIRRNT
jgi:hypothetical protein